MCSAFLRSGNRQFLLPLALILWSVAALGQQATLIADVHVTRAYPAANYGGLSNLYVGNGATSLLLFDLSTLPAGTTSAQVARATLRLYVNRVNAAGDVALQTVGSPWAETALSFETLPALTATGQILHLSAAGMFVTVDVTSQVQAWLTTPLSNNGVALTSTTADVVFDSKENDETAHPATLDLMLWNGGPAGPVGATGATGATGPQGAKGDTGAAGVQGPIGPVGPGGPQGPIGPTGATGAVGATGSAGTQGVPGATGPVGAAGPTGPVGATGTQGSPGAVFRGAYTSTTNYAANDVVTWQSAAWISVTANNHGNTPSESPIYWSIFVPAAVGVTGATGPQGIQGVQGLTGPQGMQGLVGATGATGVAGAAGKPGLVYQGSYLSTDNYDLGDVVLWQGASWASLQASNHGNTPDASPLWWGSLTVRGATGSTGAVGATGATGLQGVQGAIGPAGERGLQGPVGEAGPQGAQGLAGPMGATGAVGAQGAKGDPGPVGITFRGAYQSTTNYASNDVVTWQQQTWIAMAGSNLGNTPSLSPAWWSLLAAQGSAGPTGPQGIQGVQGATGPQGVQGAQGVIGPTGATGLQGESGGTWRGTYLSTMNYALHDIVGYNGASYISVVASNAGNTPGVSGVTQWELVAQQGAMGPTGVQGPQGVQGIQGAKGDTGVQGIQGIPGTTGTTGPPGATGAAGAVGAQGATGPTGATGTRGPAGIVWQGIYAASTSYAANDAVSYNGASYISLVDANRGNAPGFSGVTQWTLLAAVGATGATGSSGAAGSNGTSATVQIGSVTTGTAGSAAQVQNIGTSSAAVLNFTIPRGADGAAGAQGMTYRGTWSSSYGYIANDAVFYNGSSYIAQAANRNSNPASDIASGIGNWALLAQQGTAGAAGPSTVSIGSVTSGSAAAVSNSGTANAAVLNFTLPKGDTGAQGPQGLTWRGTWNGTAQYSPTDAVVQNGSSYFALVASTNVSPVDDMAAHGGSWALLASQGADGSPGVAGPVGVSGAAATISIGTTTTLPAGSSASVVNIGTSSAAVLNFSIPQGEAGTSGGASAAGAGATFASVHVVTGGAVGNTYYSPYANAAGTTETGAVLAYFPTACSISTVSFYSLSTQDETVLFRVGTSPSAMSNASVGTCTVKANAATTCTGPGALSANSFLGFRVTATITTATYLWSSFSCQ